MNPAAFNRTAKIAQQFKVIKKAPSGAYRTDIAKEAVAALKKAGVDVNGKNWKKAVVKVDAGRQVAPRRAPGRSARPGAPTTGRTVPCSPCPY